ncbi:PAAR domain-containing protein [Massilia rhizosphaerae]|uniref:PAAR domain-containing protein n=1 Tax=Massilia rhizosphaerae TaxID=2784389 RepID=UPI0018DD5A96
MKIIGWIRLGDKAACGGKVAEGLDTCTSHGVPYTYQGARMACRKNCMIAEGFSRSTLSNGRCRVIHGMSTSGGCPLYSTLNDIDGVGNESGEAIAEKHFLNADGQWVSVKEPGPKEALYDERPQLVAPPIEGVPYFIETLDGRTFSGRAEADGLLARINTFGEDEYTVYWGEEALTKMEGTKA